MTLEQMETEIAGLRETISAMQTKDEARQKDLRSLKFAAVLSGLLFVAASMGALIWGLFLSEKVPLLSSLQFTFLFTALPMILLANVVNVLVRPMVKHVDPDADVPPEVLEALRQGQTTKAIQLYRRKMGTGLEETKEFIEKLQRRTGSNVR